MLDFKFHKFDKAKKSNCIYGGSEVKVGIEYNNKKYMLKFPKVVNGQKMNNCISEYVGSNIFNLLGIYAHNTLLGEYNQSLTVACEDFASEDTFLIDFASTGESSYDVDKSVFNGYTYEEIVLLLKSHTKYDGKEDLEKFFWKLFAVDALLGNFDRHGMNWGFLKSKEHFHFLHHK